MLGQPLLSDELDAVLVEATRLLRICEVDPARCNQKPLCDTRALQQVRLKLISCSLFLLDDHSCLAVRIPMPLPQLF